MSALQLLGFPIQLFGLLLLPGAILKYLVEKESPADDVRGALVCCCAQSLKLAESRKPLSLPKRSYLTLLQNNLAKRLPGLEKESF